MELQAAQNGINQPVALAKSFFRLSVILAATAVISDPEECAGECLCNRRPSGLRRLATVALEH